MHSILFAFARNLERLMYKLTRVTTAVHEAVAVADTREELRDIAFGTLTSNNDKVLITEDETLSWVWESQGVEHYYISGEEVA